MLWRSDLEKVNSELSRFTKRGKNVGMKLARMAEGAEIFHTLQGEGISVGVAAVFVRLSLCNLHCVWCDTDHTWNFQGTPWVHEKDSLAGYAKHRKEDAIIEMGVAEVAEKVRGFGCRRVVLTGGEPLLQEAELLALMKELRRDGGVWFFEIETNGTRLPGEDFLAEIDQMNVSPKLANSGVDLRLRRKVKVLRGLAATGKAWFKFVVKGGQDVDEVKELIGDVGIGAERVILMPEGRSVQEIDEVALGVVELCKEFGFRFSDRLHVRLWGDRRGV